MNAIDAAFERLKTLFVNGSKTSRSGISSVK